MLVGQRRRARIAISSNSQKGLQQNVICAKYQSVRQAGAQILPWRNAPFWNKAPINWSLLGGREIESISLSSWFDRHFVLFYLSDNHQLRPDFGGGVPFEISVYFIHERSLRGWRWFDCWGRDPSLSLSRAHINLSIHPLRRLRSSLTANWPFQTADTSPSTCVMPHLLEINDIRPILI
jgi:hypothetical protein